MELINYKKSEMAIEKSVLLPVETHVVPKSLERFQGVVFESFVSEGSVRPSCDMPSRPLPDFITRSLSLSLCSVTPLGG